MKDEEKYQYYLKLLDAKMDALRERGEAQREKYRKIGVVIALLFLLFLFPSLYWLSKVFLRTLASF